MKEPIEIVILKDGLNLCHPTDSSVSQFVGRSEKGVAARVVDFIRQTGAAGGVIHLFVSEDLLFFKLFELPLDVLDIAEAVGFQMEMATPFADEPTWYSFDAVKGQSSYKITLYAAQSGYIDAYIQEILEGGFQLSGLFPESQRFLNKLNRKMQWGLLLPGRFFKAYVFDGATMKERLLCSAAPSFEEAVEVCHTDTLFALDPAQTAALPPQETISEQNPHTDYIDARILLSQRPLLKKYNMLPASYQRPDYLKIVIAVLLVLNVVTFLALGAVKVYKLKKFDAQVDREIENIMPLVNEMKVLRQKEEGHLKAIAQLENIGTNFDLIDFLTKLTEQMPTSSYVDQMRMDEKSNAIQIQGFTEDVTELTEKLQAVGETQLKSTSRRKNKTYFHVEVTVP